MIERSAEARDRGQLSGALHEVESSRARLVQVSYEERRQLERDLHDGAQQRLVSLGMAFRVAQRHLDDGTLDVGDLLDRSVAELGTSVAELRQIAHGLRPSSLDDGLGPALRAMLRSVPMPVDLDVCADDLPDEVATTAYFVAAEAVTNSVKHADARSIDLRVTRGGDSVVVQVRDDGHGGACLPTGSTMADRVAALSGSLHVSSPAGQGRSGAAMRVVIGEDSTVFREGLASLLADAGHEVVGKAGDAPGLLRKVEHAAPDLVLVDIRMPPTTPTTERAPHENCESATPTSASCCCPSTEKPNTRSSSSPPAASGIY